MNEITNKFSYEVVLKIARHSWNVYPLEAFGFLIGDPQKKNIYAALPCSHTKHWDRFEDRWRGLEQKRSKAESVSTQFGLQIMGYYASSQGFSDNFGENIIYPSPEFVRPDDYLIFYTTLCCVQHSGSRIYQWSDKGYTTPELYRSNPPRITKAINQKRIHKQWLTQVGRICYHNHYESEAKLS